MLNLAGVVSGKSLGRHRPWIVIGTFVFAAVATPVDRPVLDADAGASRCWCWSMISEVDRPARSTAAAAARGPSEWDDDVASPL